MPAAPLVGAVTTWPPAAFSSLTAMANKLTQSIAINGSLLLPWALRLLNNEGARRRNFNPPGRIPSRRQPRSTLRCIACQIPANFSVICCSDMNCFSFSIIKLEILKPNSLQSLINSSLVSKGYLERSVLSCFLLIAASSCSSTMKPPPIE